MTPEEIVQLFPSHRRALQDCVFAIDTLLILGNHRLSAQQAEQLAKYVSYGKSVLKTSEAKDANA